MKRAGFAPWVLRAACLSMVCYELYMLVHAGNLVRVDGMESIYVILLVMLAFTYYNQFLALVLVSFAHQWVFVKVADDVLRTLLLRVDNVSCIVILLFVVYLNTKDVERNELELG